MMNISATITAVAFASATCSAPLLGNTYTLTTSHALQPATLHQMHEIGEIFKPIEKKYFANIGPLNDLVKTATKEQKKRLTKLRISSTSDLDALWDTVIRVTAATSVLLRSYTSESEMILFFQKRRDLFQELGTSDQLSNHGRQDIARKVKVLNEMITSLEKLSHGHLPIAEAQICEIARALIGPIDCAKVAKTAQEVFDIYEQPVAKAPLRENVAKWPSSFWNSLKRMWSRKVPTSANT